jgi:phenylacetate-CoA ligase
MENYDWLMNNLYSKFLKSKFYRNKLKDINNKNYSFNDIPITRKLELSNVTVQDLLAVSKSEISHYHESSGTTGKISKNWFTRRDIVSGGEQIKNSGVKLNCEDLVLIRFPFALFLPAYLIQEASYQAGAGIVPVSSRNTVTPYRKVLEIMEELEVTIIAGIPREIELLAHCAKLLGNEVSEMYPKLRAIIVAGELLSKSRKNYLEKIWGVEIFNLYGSTETGNIATTCEHGTLHLDVENYLVEVFDENLMCKVETGQKGQAVITTLRNEAAPLLRYANEDIISIKPSGCKCGTMNPELIHYGRLSEELMVNGIKLTSYDIQESIYSLELVPVAWFVEVYSNKVEIKLEFYSNEQIDRDIIKNHFSDKLGINVCITILKKNDLLNRETLIEQNVSKKPRYIKKYE